MSITQAVFGGAVDQGRRQGYLLSDQEYYDLYIKPREQDMAREVAVQTQGIGRGGRARASQFAAAQGLGGTRVGSSLERQGAGINRQAVLEAMRAAQMRGEEYRRQQFAERDRLRGQASAALGTVGNIETALVSAAPFGMGAYLGPIQAASTAQYQGALAGMPEARAEQMGTRGKPLQTVQYDAGGYGASAPDSSRTRGGGGSDFYRTYGY